MGNQSSLDRAQDSLFDLKLTSKRFGKAHKKAQSKQKAALAKVKKLLEQGDMARARIYAQDAIRHKNEANSMLRMQSRMDAVASRIESSIMMSKVTPQMAKITRRMKGVLRVMQPEKVGKTMDQFEQICEDLDVRVAGMDASISQTTASATPESEVDSLMEQTAAEIGTKIDAELMNAGDMSALKDPKVKQREQEREAEKQLEDRLRQLRADPLAQ